MRVRGKEEEKGWGVSELGQERTAGKGEAAHDGRFEGESETESKDVPVVHLAESVLDTVVRVL